MGFKGAFARQNGHGYFSRIHSQSKKIAKLFPSFPLHLIVYTYFGKLISAVHLVKKKDLLTAKHVKTFTLLYEFRLFKTSLRFRIKQHCELLNKRLLCKLASLEQERQSSHRRNGFLVISCHGGLKLRPELD